VAKGSSREQMLRQLGEPRSQIVAGDRVIVFYARERYVLRNDVIIDFEPISAEPVRRPPPAPAAPAPVVDPAAATAAAAESREPAPATPTVSGRRVAESAPAASATGAAPVAAASVRMAPASGGAPAGAPAGVSSAVRPGPAAASEPAVAASAEPRLEIKRVLPRGASGGVTPPVRSASGADAASAAPAPAPGAAPAAAAAKAPVAANRSEPTAAPALAAPPAAGASAVALPSLDASPTVAGGREDATTSTEPVFDPQKDAAAAAAVAEKKAKVRNAVQRRIEAIGDAPPPDPTSAIWSGRNFAIMFVIVGGGIGYVVWRRRQHQLELAATAVSHSPFEVAPVNDVASGAVFTADWVGILEPRRFEDLVVSYYCKTGVVAVRANEAPESPVHVKISWKGEKRPFACVHCIARPAGLVDAKPLQQLFDVINAEGIRRGYVVTTGKFNVSARDFAEEKHLTVLHGDLFIEKLNALPGPARNEIMQEISGGAAPVAPAAPAA